MALDQKPHSRRKFILLVLFVFFVGGLTLHIMSERVAEKAWDEYKVAAAARGESMEWEKYIPVPPPDAENFYAAPIVRKWIPERGATPGTSGGKLLTRVKAKESPAHTLKVTAETTAGAPIIPWGSELGIPATIEELRKLPEAGPADELNLESLRKWFDQWNGDYEAIREAAKRPQVYLPGDYSSAPNIPILNFVAVRTVAQATASKANINLVLHHPEEARRDLESIEALIRLLDTHPRTLVAAMIQVAVGGLYLSVVHDGIEAKLWLPEQMKSIQAYVEKLDLLTPPRQALMEGERVGICHILDMANSPSGSVAAMRVKTMREMGEDSRMRELAFAMLPRGWIRRNELYIAGAMDRTVSVVDLKAHRFYSTRAKAVGDDLEQELSDFSINRMIARVAIPNFSKAFQTTAKNQSMAYHAAISCALERYKGVKGSYPDNLSQLQPEFITTVPTDVVGGTPMHYIRKGEGYLLYSIGVNERDDGGDEKTDWVWKI